MKHVRKMRLDKGAEGGGSSNLSTEGGWWTKGVFACVRACFCVQMKTSALVVIGREGGR